MPGNIASASPSLVLPKMLCTAFAESRGLDVLSSRYVDGSVQILPVVLSSRRKFTLSCRLSPTQLATLKAFWVSVNGTNKPFYYYNPVEAIDYNGSNYDSTGVSATGRHTVVFSGAWSQTTGLSRSDVPFALIEVA